MRDVRIESPVKSEGMLTPIRNPVRPGVTLRQGIVSAGAGWRNLTTGIVGRGLQSSVFASSVTTGRCFLICTYHLADFASMAIVGQVHILFSRRLLMIWNIFVPVAKPLGVFRPHIQVMRADQ